MDSNACDYHPDRQPFYIIVVEGGGLVNVCKECRDFLLGEH